MSDQRFYIETRAGLFTKGKNLGYLTYGIMDQTEIHENIKISHEISLVTTKIVDEVLN